MRRIGLIALLAAVIAAGAVGAGARAPSRHARRRSARRGSCKDPVVGWMVGTNSVSATCDPAWRVALSPQYQADDGRGTGAGGSSTTSTTRRSTRTSTPGAPRPRIPTCCVLYWDDGDGTEAFTPLCRNPWRIHAGFWTETPAGPAKFADAYSDPTPVTCPEPRPRS